MNEDSQLPDNAPGSGAGDAATSQEIPRLPKPTKSPAKKSARKAPSKVGASSATVTDKGRARDIPLPDAQVEQEPETDETPKTSGPRRIEPVDPGRPLTAADYARTTKSAPDSTAVIPAVKDEPKVVEQVASTATSSASGRQASLRLNHVEPWSVARITFAISVAMMIVGVVAMTIFWIVLNLVGVWDQVNEAVTSVLSDDSSSFNITDYLGFWRLIGLTLVLSAINVVLMTALATIGAHLYNLAAQVLGGVEVTFSEER
ncbi:DUF3566 domain-containing protein [Aeromicrobium panaciterrae]|uniref:DUF3566 domain-containing protein n=1 Tax=Aeromicrobium panaciterrae TaxID=363861 RepID=UPI0031CFEF27